jgi:starch synthase
VHDGPLRVLGVTLEPVTRFRVEPSAKSAGLFAGLSRRYEVVDIVRPVLSPLDAAVNRLRTFYPSRTGWFIRASLNPWAFEHRTRAAEAALRRREGEFDLIVQLHTLVAPGRRESERPYVLHTDNTYMMSERHYPAWLPSWGGRRRDAWVRMERDVYQRAAFLFPRSEFLRRSLIEDYGCEPARVIRVGGGANLAAASLAGKRYDQQTAIFVGYDFERKGGEVLLRAWRLVRRRLPRAQLLIVGPSRRGADAAQGVRWVGRVEDRAALADLYSRATAFVMPSLFEPWGHVFLEAMGHGLPCIGADHCAMPEIIAEGETGRLAKPGDAESLANALFELLADPAGAASMGHRAQASVSHGHTWDDVVSRMAPYIEQAARRR